MKTLNQFDHLAKYNGTKHFRLDEIVPDYVVKRFGVDRAVHLMDENFIHTICQIRLWFDAPMYINTTHIGGKLKHRGWRPYQMPRGSKSAAASVHKLGMAIDFNIKGMASDDVYAEIMKNELMFYKFGVRRIEHLDFTPSWTHIDSFGDYLPFSVIDVIKP